MTKVHLVTSLKLVNLLSEGLLQTNRLTSCAVCLFLSATTKKISHHIRYIHNTKYISICHDSVDSAHVIMNINSGNTRSPGVYITCIPFNVSPLSKEIQVFKTRLLTSVIHRMVSHECWDV